MCQSSATGSSVPTPKLIVPSPLLEAPISTLSPDITISSTNYATQLTVTDANKETVFEGTLSEFSGYCFDETGTYTAQAGGQRYRLPAQQAPPTSPAPRPGCSPSILPSSRPFI